MADRLLRVLFWGTYDTGKPRVRILLRGLREAGVEVVECHAEIWRGVEDKSQVASRWRKGALLARWLLSYPWLVLRYLWAPGHDAVVVGYLGNLDVLVLRPFAWMRRKPIVWDAFLSLYNTAVEDRGMASPGSPLGRALYALDWMACRAADLVVTDTQAHADYFCERFGVSPEKAVSVFVGVEPEAFPSGAPVRATSGGPFSVLFYGQFIPLHGLSTIVGAARLTRGEEIHWTLIGQGQEEAKVRELLAAEPIPDLEWIPWVPYGELVERIRSADVCLGIFGTSGKAARVIPNKVFQVIAAGAPVITRDSPAIRELVGDGAPGVILIPPGDASALADALRAMKAARGVGESWSPVESFAARLRPRALGEQLASAIQAKFPRKRGDGG